MQLKIINLQFGGAGREADFIEARNLLFQTKLIKNFYKQDRLMALKYL